MRATDQQHSFMPKAGVWTSIDDSAGSTRLYLAAIVAYEGSQNRPFALTVVLLDAPTATHSMVSYA